MFILLNFVEFLFMNSSFLDSYDLSKQNDNVVKYC